MPFLVFLSGAVVISLSGVLAPGPVTAVTIGKGNDSPHSGAWIAIGHGFVEFPLMILLALGIGHFLTNASLKTALEILGGLVLIFMAIGLLRGIAGDPSTLQFFRDRRCWREPCSRWAVRFSSCGGQPSARR